MSDSSLFVTIVPRRFGLCATNEAFVTKMRLYLNMPINQLLSKEKCICSNSPQLTLRHALNGSKLITYRSSLHDAVRDTVFNMAQTARISCIKEPLLKETLSLNNFGSDDRGDVYCDWIDNSEAIVDFVSCNVANDTLVHRKKLNPVAALDFKAKEKHRKYDKEIEDANVDRNTQLVFIAFPFSINGRLSVEAETFLDDFQKMVKEKTMKRFFFLPPCLSMPPKSVTSKPSRGRPKNSVTTCSLCKTVGHTKTTCSRRKVLSDEAVLASLSSPIESIEPPQILHSSSVSSNTKSCLFCCSPVSGFNVSGRPLLVCDSCTPIDPCRPPFAIPQFVSPAHSSSLATVIRSLTFSLRKGIWNPSIFWKFFLSKAISRFHNLKMSKKRFESLILRSQYSSALKLLAGSSPAAFNDETLDSLNSLHPHEDFTINHIVSDNERDFFTANPITCDEVSVAIKGLPSGRSAGPSGLSYDHLKSAVNICPEIVDDLVFLFLIALMASRLVALNKPGGGVRPIAVGESITRLLAIISFKRVKSSAINFFRPYQFAIGIPDGTTCAALCTDLLFNQKGENYLLNIDFKNAFNSVFRSSILHELELHYPPLLPYFKLMYGSPSNLIFHSENIVSSRGVKQGDPLGPFFFCLALQSVLVKFKSDFPDIHICAYADDLSLIGPLSLFTTRFYNILFFWPNK
ncbi:hypothetical protein P9112_013202 [Eukaryota sp. TZLM1-RC]